MIIKKDYKDHFDELWKLYKEAEDEISRISTLSNGLDCTPVNQLRYAGRHILDTISGNITDPVDEELTRAKRHCERAIYDAKDTGIVFYLTKIQQFKDDYRGIEITPTVPNYLEIISDARAAKQFVDQARSESDGRHSFYPEVREHLDKIEGAWTTLENAREELNIKLRNHNRNVILGYIGVIIAIAGLIIAILAYNQSTSSSSQQSVTSAPVQTAPATKTSEVHQTAKVKSPISSKQKP